jgi:hypothetical protein
VIDPEYHFIRETLSITLFDFLLYGPLLTRKAISALMSFTEKVSGKGTVETTEWE